MKTLPILTIIAAAGLSTGAMAQDDRQEQAQTQTQAQSEEDEDDEYMQEVVCRTERVTGSLTRVNRTCLTRQEWNILRERTAREVDRIDRDANQSAGIPRQDIMGGS